MWNPACSVTLGEANSFLFTGFYIFTYIQTKLILGQSHPSLRLHVVLFNHWTFWSNAFPMTSEPWSFSYLKIFPPRLVINTIVFTALILRIPVFHFLHFVFFYNLRNFLLTNLLLGENVTFYSTDCFTDQNITNSGALQVVNGIFFIVRLVIFAYPQEKSIVVSPFPPTHLCMFVPLIRLTDRNEIWGRDVLLVPGISGLISSQNAN